jgi:hypothetical protein
MFASGLPRFFTLVRPERIAQLKIDCGIALWSGPEAHLPAVLPLLRPSCRLTLWYVSPLVEDQPEEAAAITTFLNDNAGRLDGVDIDLTTHDNPMAYLKRAAAEGGLFHAANAYLPALNRLRLGAIPDGSLSDVPALRDHLRFLDYSRLHVEEDDLLHLGFDHATGLRRLRTLALSDWNGYVDPDVTIGASLFHLTSLTSLILSFHASSVTLEDPEGRLDSPGVLFPALESAALTIPGLPQAQLLRLLPALHHVTRLHLRSMGGRDEIKEGLSTLSRLRDLQFY